MGRPPHPVGTSGGVQSYRSAAGWRTRTTVRDHDEAAREIQRPGRTKAEAERKLAIAIRTPEFPETVSSGQLNRRLGCVVSVEGVLKVCR